MIKNKKQAGRPMVEVLAVLSVGAVLTIFSILTIRKGMYTYKSNSALDYVNSVYSSVRGKDKDSLLFSNAPENGIPCERIVSDMPSIISVCKVTHICGCGSNTETADCTEECTPRNSSRCIFIRNNPNDCVTTVSFILRKGEKNTATTLESRLELEIREEMGDSSERIFRKANCLGDYPQECSNGFARCVGRNSVCSNISRTRCTSTSSSNCNDGIE